MTDVASRSITYKGHTIAVNPNGTAVGVWVTDDEVQGDNARVEVFTAPQGVSPDALGGAVTSSLKQWRESRVEAGVEAGISTGVLLGSVGFLLALIGGDIVGLIALVVIGVVVMAGWAAATYSPGTETYQAEAIATSAIAAGGYGSWLNLTFSRKTFDSLTQRDVRQELHEPRHTFTLERRVELMELKYTNPQRHRELLAQLNKPKQEFKRKSMSKAEPKQPEPEKDLANDPEYQLRLEQLRLDRQYAHEQAMRDKSRRELELAQEEWQRTVALHEDLNQKFLDSQMNWETLLTVPELTKVENKHTASMIDAFNLARDTDATPPPYLTEVEDPEHHVTLDITKELYYQRVKAFQRAWNIAYRHARKVGLKSVPPEERTTIRRVTKLLRTATHPATPEHERRSSYAKAIDMLKDLTYVHVPKEAMLELDRQQQEALPQ